MTLNLGKTIWKDGNAYYFLFVRIVNRFLSKELVLVSHTIFGLDIFSFICVLVGVKLEEKLGIKSYIGGI
jgi:hypothetical protein